MRNSTAASATLQWCYDLGLPVTCVSGYLLSPLVLGRVLLTRPWEPLFLQVKQALASMQTGHSLSTITPIGASRSPVRSMPPAPRRSSPDPLPANVDPVGPDDSESDRSLAISLGLCDLVVAKNNDFPCCQFSHEGSNYVPNLFYRVFGDMQAFLYQFV